MRLTPTWHLVAGVTALGLLVAACGAPDTGETSQNSDGAAASEVPDKPSEPVTLNVFDVAGNLQLTQGMIEEFAEKNPDVIAEVNFEQGPAPDLVGKITAQQDAGKVDIGLVLTGTDGLSAGVEEDIWVPIVSEFGDRLSNMDTYIEPAAEMQTLAQDQGVVVTYYPSGPLLEYNPEKVPNPPTTAEELLAWAKENPGRFGYARPANSGPGRTFLMGLPYILGDKDPMDPINGWEKTWAYLAELNQYADYYPTGTTPTMKNLADGTWDIIATTTGWDINPRALGTVPNTVDVQKLDGFTWVTDAHYAVIPDGVDADTQSAVLLLIQDMLTPEQNAKAYDAGYFYPGPAVEGATLDLAPQESQDTIAEFGRDEYADWIEDNPKALPLDAENLVAAFDKWDREIGQGKTQEG